MTNVTGGKAVCDFYTNSPRHLHLPFSVPSHFRVTNSFAACLRSVRSHGRSSVIPSLIPARLGHADPMLPLPATDKLAVERVNFWYGAKQALFDIDLTIPERSVVAFI